MTAYANMTKAQLINELNARDERIVKATEAYRALESRLHEQCTMKKPTLKEEVVGKFADKAAALAALGADISKYVFRKEGDELVFFKKVWVRTA